MGFIPQNYIQMVDENEVMVDAPDFAEQPPGRHYGVKV